MADRRPTPKPAATRLPPGKTPESRELQMVSLAFDLAQERLENGSASAQEIVYLLKLGSTERQLELEQLRHKNVLIEAQATQLGKNDRMEELWAEGIAAFKGYASGPTDEVEILG